MSAGKQWLSEGLFWLHFLVILGGVLMGLVLPWWLAISAVITHRLHLKVFDGCALSKLQKKTNCLVQGRDYLQDLSFRLFNKQLAKKYVKTADRLLVGASLVVILFAYVGLGWLVMASITTLFAAYGVKASWRMLNKPTQNVCMVGSSCNDAKQSRFSNIFGLPVEFMAIGYFGLLVIGQMLLALNNFQPALLQTLLFGLLAAGLAVSAVFIFLQARVIRSLCTSCMNIHGVSFSVGIVQMTNLIM